MAEASPHGLPGSLPDELWSLVFSRIREQERHATLPLVCRRWRRLASSAELLRSLDVELDGEAWLQRTLQFLRWLQGAPSQHVRQLGLKVANPGGADAHEAAQLLEALAAACAATRSLRQLRFDPEAMPLQLGAAWAAALPRTLRRLRLDVVVGELELAADLRPLAALEELWLDGQPLRVVPEARLPPSLTALRLGGDEGAAAPPQLAALSRLRRLTLRSTEYDPRRGYALLPQLASLRELLLLHCARLPPCLAQLGGLRALVLTATPSDPEGDAEQDWAGGLALQPVLAALTQLTSLAIRDCPVHCGIPAALAGLAHLQRLVWDVAPPPGAGYCTSWHLPAGPWLASLRVAALPAACVAASLPQLAAVAQLQSLSMRQFGALPDEAQRGVLQWAGAHPALGRLCLGSYPRVQLGPRAFAALLAAQLRKPGLAIEPGSGLFQEPDAD